MPQRDHRIKLDEAQKHTRRHRDRDQPNKDGDKGGAFDGAQVMQLLQQQGCWGVRIYHGRSDKGERSLVLVGIDADGRELTQGVMLESCYPCPPFCDEDSDLA
jgi:hypothetical protein